MVANDDSDSDSSIVCLGDTAQAKPNTRGARARAGASSGQRTTRSASQKQQKEQARGRQPYDPAALSGVIEIGSSSAEEETAPPTIRRAANVSSAAQPMAKRAKTSKSAASSEPSKFAAAAATSKSTPTRGRAYSQSTSHASSRASSSRRSTSRNVRKPPQPLPEEDEGTEHEMIVVSHRGTRRSASAESGGRPAPRLAALASPPSSSSAALPVVPEHDESPPARARPATPSPPPPAPVKKTPQKRRQVPSPSPEPPAGPSRASSSPEPRPRAIGAQPRQPAPVASSPAAVTPRKHSADIGGDESDDDFDIFARRGRALNWASAAPATETESHRARPAASSSRSRSDLSDRESLARRHVGDDGTSEGDEDRPTPKTKLSNRSGSKTKPQSKATSKRGGKRSASKEASEEEDTEPEKEWVPRAKRAKSSPSSVDPELHPSSHRSASPVPSAPAPTAPTAKTPVKNPLSAVFEEDELTPKASLEPEDLELQQWLAERRAKKGNLGGTAAAALSGSPSKKAMCRLTVRTRVTPSYRSQRSARTVKKYEQSKVFTQPMDRRLEDIGEWAKAVFKKDVILVCKGQRVYSLMLSPEALKWDENVQIDAYERSAYEEWQRQLEEDANGPSEPAVDAIEIDDDEDEDAAEADAAISVASASDAGEDDEVMALTLRGAAGDVAVKAKLTTKIVSLVKHYCTKHKIDLPFKKAGRGKQYMAIEVDGSPLDPEKTVGDYEDDIEDGDMLTVGTFKG